MKLEEIAKVYGMNDYYDMATGRIYKLSNALPTGVIGKVKVPVIEDGVLIGYCEMEVEA